LSSAVSTSRPQLVAKQSETKDRCTYFRIQLHDATSSQDRFFDADYSDALRRMALSVVASHGPIRDDELVREIARAHGFARTGNRIKQRILSLLPDITSTEEPVGRFLWSGSAPSESIPFRYPASEDQRRSLEKIPMAELAGLVRELPMLMMHDDPASALARQIGLERLSQAARQRLEEALKSEGKKALPHLQ
jgi:hypothetical protein